MKNRIKIVACLCLIVAIFIKCDREYFNREWLLSTGPVVELSYTWANVGGRIIDSGEGLDEYGHCWAEGMEPTIENERSVFTDVTEDMFFSRASDLESGRKYYYRTYVKKGSEVAYGSIEVLDTKKYTLPEIRIDNITNIKGRSATFTVNLYNLGSENVVNSGVCCSINSDLSTPDYVLEFGETDSVISKVIELNNLKPNTKYYLKAFAENIVGIEQSNVVSFSTIYGGIVANGLIIYYPFTGNTKDSSGFARNPRVSGLYAGSDRFDNLKSSYLLSYDGSYFDIPRIFNPISSEWSYSVWFNLTSLPSEKDDAFLLSREKHDNNSDIFLYIDNDDNMVKSAFFKDKSKLSSGVAIEKNKWYHAVLTYNKETVNIYINGELKASSPKRFTVGMQTTEYFRISSLYNNYWNTLVGRFFGKIDDVRLYNRAINPDEVYQLYSERGWL